MKVELTHDMAHAILDAEDICFNDGLGPREDRMEAWEALLHKAEQVTDRKAHSTFWKERNDATDAGPSVAYQTTGVSRSADLQHIP